MKPVFADAFYYIAFLSASDEAHAQAAAFTESFTGKMVTTAWVLTEVADGMAPPKTRSGFWAFLAVLRNDPEVKIIPHDPELFEAGLTLYGARPDKGWSLTDCISFVVMRREGITEALTGDHHFEQAGFRILLK